MTLCLQCGCSRLQFAATTMPHTEISFLQLPSAFSRLWPAGFMKACLSASFVVRQHGGFWPLVAACAPASNCPPLCHLLHACIRLSCVGVWHSVCAMPAQYPSGARLVVVCWLLQCFYGLAPFLGEFKGKQNSCVSTCAENNFSGLLFLLLVCVVSGHGLSSNYSVSMAGGLYFHCPCL